MIGRILIREALGLDSAERRQKAAMRLAQAKATVNTQATSQALRDLKDATTERLAIETGREA
jgi:hypothetical protein